MSTWDPEAAGNAAIYLRLPQEDMLAKQNAPYAGRTAVWIPSAETSYQRGIVLGDGSKPGTKSVEREDGKKKDYKVRVMFYGEI